MNALFERLGLQVRLRRILSQAPDQALEIIHQALEQELARSERQRKYPHETSAPAHPVPD